MLSLENNDIELAMKTFGITPAAIVSKIVNPADTMWHLAHKPIGYANHGASAVSFIEAVRASICNPPPNSILDFGCGHGRVGRWLRAIFPKASLTGAEILPDAVRFYSQILQADGWNTSADLTKNMAPKPFDIIWCGSVFTHLPVRSAEVLFLQFIDWLNVGGFAVFSVHGRISTGLFKKNGVPNVDKEIADAAIIDFENGNYGFSAYRRQENYGMSYSPAAWWTNLVMASSKVRLISYSEGGWAGNQDIVAIQKLPSFYIPRSSIHE